MTSEELAALLCPEYKVVDEALGKMDALIAKTKAETPDVDPFKTDEMSRLVTEFGRKFDAIRQGFDYE